MDGDRQGAAQNAISIRLEIGQLSGVACATYPNGLTLRYQIEQLSSKFDDIIIDAGGRDLPHTGGRLNYREKSARPKIGILLQWNSKWTTPRRIGE